ncbi:Alpha/beta hydrolase fold-3 [Obba rivulosa]|uniref:Alpha/beta hydrolase fold-3 n=1 Tax=Obba rivulosa TaxID=1052685 RepID=A0A8E2DKS7_9APHY|nr:Alpha/beta hydrolase fold-3 [Obba rivulosa]
MHSGAWRVGNLDMDDYFLRILAVELQVVVVNVDYRLAPEYRLPACLDDSYTGLKWAAINASRLCASLSKGFIVGGQSAGGNLAVVITHRARDDPFFADTPLTGSLFSIASVVHPDAVPELYKPELLSVEQYRDGPVLTKEAILKSYEDLTVEPMNPEISPLLYPSHKDLPPAYIQVCGLDPRRDESFLYERLLREAGAKFKIDVYPGVPHGSHALFPSLKQTSKEDLKKRLAWLLRGGR